MSDKLQIGDVITLDNDMWEDSGKKFTIMAVAYRPDSTAVDMMLEVFGSRELVQRVVPLNQISKV